MGWGGFRDDLFKDIGYVNPMQWSWAGLDKVLRPHDSWNDAFRNLGEGITGVTGALAGAAGLGSLGSAGAADAGASASGWEPIGLTTPVDSSALSIDSLYGAPPSSGFALPASTDVGSNIAGETGASNFNWQKALSKALQQQGSNGSGQVQHSRQSSNQPLGDFSISPSMLDPVMKQRALVQALLGGGNG